MYNLKASDLIEGHYYACSCDGQWPHRPLIVLWTKSRYKHILCARSRKYRYSDGCSAESRVMDYREATQEEIHLLYQAIIENNGEIVLDTYEII